MTQQTCIICGCKKPLIPHRTKENRKCPDCGSLPRQRNLFGYLTEGNKIESKKVLHVAPERCLLKYVRNRSGSCHFVDKCDSLLQCSKDDINDMKVFSDEAFDFAICFHVLEHIKDDEAAIKEFARVLNKGGSLLLSVPLKEENTHDWTESEINEQKNAGKWGVPGRYDGHYRTYGRDELEERLKKHFSTVQKSSPNMTSEEFFICTK